MTKQTTSSAHTAAAARQALLGGLAVTERRVDLAGISTALLEAGTGPPIVLLHGPGEFAERWVRVIPGLAAANRVIAPDFPGHGGSAGPDGDFDVDLVFRWLDVLIDECCDAPPVLVGHILGGAVAARYAVGRSDRISRLVLVDSLGLGRFRPSPKFALGLLGFMAHPSDRSHHRFMGQCLADRTTVEEAMGDRWDALRDYSLDRAKDPGVKAAMKFFMSEMGVPRIPVADLEAITVPTSLVWGRHDKANRLRVGQAASERLGWPLHIIEDAADDPPIEQPDQFVAAVLG